MDSITIDGLNEDDFRCSIEGMLRDGQADDAAAKLRALIEPYAGEAGVLPARLLSVSPADFTLNGWNELGNRLGKYDRPGHWVSAIGISIVDPSEAAAFADAPARLAPCLETSFYSDDAYPFSKSGREDLLEGYTRQGAEWQGNFEQADMTLTVSGVEDLYEAVAQLEARLFASETPDNQEICAGSLAACYLSVLLHQAVRDKIRGEGLPRPLCVMAGCVGVYPFFDAPVVSSEECLDGGFTGMEVSAPARREAQKAGEADVEAVATAAPDTDDAFGSLLSLTPRMAKKKMVIELDEEESAAATRQFELASAHQLDEARDAPPKASQADYTAYAFDGSDGLSGLPEDDDWSDIPEGPLNPESRIDRDMDDWFGDLGQAAGRQEPTDMFPAEDVAGLNFGGFGADLPGAGFELPETEFEPLEPLPPAPDTIAAQDLEWTAWESEELPDGAPDDVAHPDAAYHIPPQPAAGHELRARLAHSLQAEAQKKHSMFESLWRVLAWIRRKWF